jgi:hypothetical protein
VESAARRRKQPWARATAAALLAQTLWDSADPLSDHEPGAKSVTTEGQPRAARLDVLAAYEVSGAKSVEYRGATPAAGRLYLPGPRSPAARQLEGELAYRGRRGSASNRR